MPVPGLGNVEAVAMGERHGWCPASMRVYVKKKKVNVSKRMSGVFIACLSTVKIFVSVLTLRPVYFHNPNKYWYMTACQL